MSVCPCGEFSATGVDDDDLDDIQSAVNDAARCLRRPDPSASEALIYLERALQTLEAL